ncbi:hypothetical protein FBR01_08705 [Anaerolineae bacterium CFX8]|nr:hypothetical protein [Anaerolineae bacterium CFX8]
MPTPLPSLIPGEYLLGQYQVTIARYTASGWAGTVPPLNAAITNFRLILQPQTRRPYEPASIPSTYVVKVCDVLLDHRPGILISLKTGHRLYLFIWWSQGEKLSDALRTMLTSPIGSDSFHHNLRPGDLERLIRFISRL